MNKYIQYKNYYIAKVYIMPSRVMWYIGTFKGNDKTIDNFLSVIGMHTLKAAKEQIDRGFVDNEIKREYAKYSTLYKCIG